MKFREWLVLNEAVMAKQGVEFSTPENIAYLSGFPKSRWVDALAKKYGDFLIDYVNDGKEPQGLPSDPQMGKLVQQLRGIGVDLRNISRETRSGDMLRLAKTSQASDRMVRRLLAKWLAASMGVPSNSLDKNGKPIDPDTRTKFDSYLKTLRIDDLKPNVGVMWFPNAMEQNVNSYDRPQDHDQALWELAKFLKVGTPKEADQAIKDRASKLINGYVARGKLPADQSQEFSDALYQYVMNNLMRFDPKSANPLPWSKLSTIMATKALNFVRRQTTQNQHSMNTRVASYNQDQAASNYTNSTPDVYRTADDPVAIRNRVIPKRQKRSIPVQTKPKPKDWTMDDVWAMFKQRDVG